MQPQKACQGPRVVDQRCSKFQRRQGLLDELFGGTWQFLEFHESASKRASELSVCGNRPGRHHRQGPARSENRCARTIEISGSLEDRAKVELVVPVARILERDSRAAMKFD